MRKSSNIIVSYNNFAFDSLKKWSDMMVYSKSDPALLMVSSGLFMGAEVLHGKKKTSAVAAAKRVYLLWRATADSSTWYSLKCHTSVTMLK